MGLTLGKADAIAIGLRTASSSLAVPPACHIRRTSSVPDGQPRSLTCSRYLAAKRSSSMNASRGYAWVENDPSPGQTRRSLIRSTRRSPPPRSSGRPWGLTALPIFIRRGGMAGPWVTDKDGVALVRAGSVPPR
jgi:hypothetical protein